MLSLQNAKSSRNRILTVRCAMIILLSAGLLMLSAISTTNVGAQDQSATTKFRRVGKPIPNQYIVVLDDNIPGSEVASRAAEMAFTTGGSVGHIYRYALRGFSARMSEVAAIALSQDSRVEFVEEDGLVSVGTTQTNPPWGLDRIDQRDLPLDSSYSYNQDGTGVKVYIIDTGIRASHQDFDNPSRVSLGTDVVGDGQNGADCVPHGTQVASVAGGHTYGVAKGVSLINVRVVNCSGQGGTSLIISGVDWVSADHVSGQPAVANVSLQPSASTSLDKAVRRSIAAGVNYVVIAGNQNQDASNISPARVTQAITVGATDITDTRWVETSLEGSNFGTVLDLFAPGKDIPAAYASGDTDTLTDSGTSLAGPHVTGAVAQYLQTDTTACQSTVSDVITSNATSNKVTNPGTGSPNLLLYTPQTWPTPTYYSLSLNGSTAYVDVPNTPAGTGVSIDITGPVTVEAWIKLNSAAVRQGIIERYNASAGTGTTDGGYALRVLSNGKLRFFVFKNAFEYSNVTSATALTTGQWYHVAGVYDGTQLRIYIQGMLDVSAGSSFTPATGTSNLKIGVSSDGGGFFNRLIDEARVTAVAVYSGSSFTLQHKITGVVSTVGLWRFDRQNAKDCADVNNGTLVGGATFSTVVP